MLYPVLVETYQLLLRRAPLPTAHAWLEQVTSSVSFVNPDDEDYLQAARRIRAYGDQQLTLVDAVLAVVSERLGPPVWTYDYHFDVMRIDRWR